MKTTKTWFPKEKDLVQRWRHIDAAGMTLGRLADDIAMILMGKTRPTYTPFALTGDFVVITNAAKIKTTGNKARDKIYYRHSGYIGNLRAFTLEEMMERSPERVLALAVKGMLPVNTRRAHLMKRLKIYAGPEHPHEAQVKGYPAEPAESKE